MTLGTAYGRKMAIRLNRRSRVHGQSSSSANTSASPSIVGTRTAPYMRTRPTPAQNSPSPSTER
jgi:hypothetical protein